MQILNKRFVFTIVLVVSLIVNVVLIFAVANTVSIGRKDAQVQQKNQKVLAFTNLFIEKVLMSNQDVSFDTRLTLETMVRNLNDKEVLDQWEKFTGAADNQNASIEAKQLLNLLIKKISY